MADTGTFSTAAAGGGAQGLLERIRTAFDVLLLRGDAVERALDDERGFPYAVAIVSLAGVAIAVGRGAALPGILLFAALQVVTSLLLAAVIHLGARLVFEAEHDFARFYRAFGATYLIFWASGVPVVHALLVWLLWAWQIAAAVLVTEHAYRLDRVRAAVLVAVPVAVGLLAAAVFNGLVALVALSTGRLF